MTSTMLGGMIWPSVPEAQMMPVETAGEYARLSMAGSEMSPMVTTVAPTMPVEAANRPPTRQTEIPSPPPKLPQSWAMVSSRSSAIFERSSTTPIKTNSGTAIRVSLDMMP